MARTGMVMAEVNAVPLPRAAFPPSRRSDPPSPLSSLLLPCSGNTATSYCSVPSPSVLDQELIAKSTPPTLLVTGSSSSPSLFSFRRGQHLDPLLLFSYSLRRPHVSAGLWPLCNNRHHSPRHRSRFPLWHSPSPSLSYTLPLPFPLLLRITSHHPLPFNLTRVDTGETRKG